MRKERILKKLTALRKKAENVRIGLKNFEKVYSREDENNMVFWQKVDLELQGLEMAVDFTEYMVQIAYDLVEEGWYKEQPFDENTSAEIELKAGFRDLNKTVNNIEEFYEKFGRI